MNKQINIPGWQSWSPTRKRFIKIPAYFYSPHKINSWDLFPTHRLKKTITGWCSWYAYGANIDEKRIIFNVDSLESNFGNKFEYVLIDDGWCKHGDWNNCYQDRFPSGMKKLASNIKKKGLKSGIWLAPFWIHPKSQIAQTNPEYVMKFKGYPVEGYPLLNLPKWFNYRNVLDIENPKAYKHLQRLITTIVEDWGYELLKLDFLYSIYFNPRYKSTNTPDHLLGKFLKWIRDKYPHIYIIGCGCPLGPAAGLVDAMRISSDTIFPFLDNIWPINYIANTSRINQLEQNLEDRKDFQKIWNIDPDAFVARNQTGLSFTQVKRLYELIKNSDGLLFLGDELNTQNVKIIKSLIN